MASFSPLFPGLTAGDTISPDQDQLTGTEGKSVTMKCNYQTDSNFIQLYWYKHDSGKPPEFLISHTGTGLMLLNPVSGFSFKVNDDKTQMDLQISSAAVTDSAVYYCAVKPTVTGNDKTLYKNYITAVLHPLEGITHSKSTDCDDIISPSLCCSERTEFICCLCVFKNSKDMLLYLFLLLSHILGEFKNRDSSLLQTTACI
uniref:Ig-like domain-containing protein n=1 Tax=Oryzias melastigma TaxID=30732 RepID=A0A3B3BX82_ORYME